MSTVKHPRSHSNDIHILHFLTNTWQFPNHKLNSPKHLMSVNSILTTGREKINYLLGENSLLECDMAGKGKP